MSDTPEREVHYVAHVRIEKVLAKVVAEPNARPPIPARDREVEELTQIVIKDSDLPNLRDRLTKHIDLIEEL